jgi:hypothetical protein
MGSIDLNLLEKAFIVSGIIAGVAFLAGIEIFMKAKFTSKKKGGFAPMMTNSVWLFMLAGILLLAAFISLAVLSNYVARFNLQSLYWLTIISIAIFVIGFIALFCAIGYFLFSWGKDTAIKVDKNDDPIFPGRLPIVIVSAVMILYIFTVFVSPLLFR